MTTQITDIQFKNYDNEVKTLKDYSAKVYLIVNVASKCGLTHQYSGLQEVYKKYKDRGLEILAFPANEFLGQEPGTNSEIQDFCTHNFNVTFPVLSKIVVKGEGQHELYYELTNQKKDYVKNEDGAFEKLLTEKKLISGLAHDIKWNFEKFLVASNGKILERFFPDIPVTDSRILSLIDKHLS